MADLAKQKEQALADKDTKLARLIEEERRTLGAELDNMKSKREVSQATITKWSRGQSMIRWVVGATRGWRYYRYDHLLCWH